MKTLLKITTVLLFVIISVVGYGQLSPTTGGRIANATTAFGVNLSMGAYVYDLNTKKLYFCDVASASTLTLTTGSANFTLVGGSGVGTGTVTSVGLTAGTTGTDIGISGSPITGAGSITLNIPTASATNRGALSSTDWSTFNSKEPAVTKGNLTEATSSVLTVTGGTGSVIGSGTSIQVKQATTSQSGYLSSTDWNTFNGKGSGNGTVTSVAALTIGTTGTDLGSTVATGTSTPVITLNVPTASATNRGALSSADWSTFNGKLSSEVDGSISNEGALSVTAGTGTTSVIHSNTSGSTDVTLTAGTGTAISEVTGTGTITLTANTSTVQDFEMSTADSAAINHYHYTLTSTPVSSTITVSVNGVVTTNYTMVAGVKVRLGFAIGQYDKISVRYQHTN